MIINPLHNTAFLESIPIYWNRNPFLIRLIILNPRSIFLYELKSIY